LPRKLRRLELENENAAQKGEGVLSTGEGRVPESRKKRAVRKEEQKRRKRGSFQGEERKEGLGGVEGCHWVEKSVGVGSEASLYRGGKNSREGVGD